MPVLIVVPARVGSTRLPRKPLQPLAGVPLIARVYQRAMQVPGINRVVVATDSREVVAVLASSGAEVVMTSPHHPSGTDRVAEVARMPAYRGYEVIVNLQGDEPFLPLDAVTGAIRRVEGGDQIGTAAAPLDPRFRNDPAHVKVVSDGEGRALYFSRAAIPAVRESENMGEALWWRHIGVYAYRAEVLQRVAALPPSPLEQLERLEQLRALQAGFTIGVSFLDHPAWPGIDTPDDLAIADARWPDFAEAC